MKVYNFQFLKFQGDVIDSIANYIKESLKKDHRYKGITTAEYMDCMARLAVTKENKIKVKLVYLLKLSPKSRLKNFYFKDNRKRYANCV